MKTRNKPFKILFLPIETISRELDSKLVLAYCALSNGYSVVIGRTRYVKPFAEHMGFGVYWGKSHNRKNFPFSADPAKTRAFLKVALDEEGLIFLDDETFLRRSRVSEIDFLDYIFVWGGYQRDLLVSSHPEIEPRVAVVGNSRFDVLQPAYQILRDEAVQRIKSRYGDYVLINTNFGPGNFDPRDKVGYMGSLEKGKRIVSAEDLKFYTERQDYYRKLFIAYVDMIKAVSAEFPELKFVVRPHPVEDHNAWRRKLESLQNVEVIYEGSAAEWIAGAKALIHTGCTTGIEALFMGCPVLRYNPFLDKGYEVFLPNLFGYRYMSIKELIEGLRTAISGELKNTLEDRSHLAEKYLSNIKGGSFFDRIDNIFKSGKFESYLNHENQVYRQDAMTSLAKELSMVIRRFVTKYHRILQRIFGKEIVKILSSSEFQKFPGLSKTYVIDFLKKVDTIHGRKVLDKLNVKKISKDTYLLIPD